MSSTVEASEGLTPGVVGGLLPLFEHMFERPEVNQRWAGRDGDLDPHCLARPPFRS